jgi:anti-sigma B factor antagonist
MARLRYEVVREAQQTTLRIEGDVDLHVAVELRQALHRQIASPPPILFVDLAGVPFVDSSAIATLVEALKLLRAKGSNLRVINCQPAVRDTFEIARLTRSFGIEEAGS